MWESQTVPRIASEIPKVLPIVLDFRTVLPIGWDFRMVPRFEWDLWRAMHSDGHESVLRFAKDYRRGTQWLDSCSVPLLAKRWVPL